MSSPSLSIQQVRIIGRKFYEYCKINGDGKTIEAYVQDCKEYTAAEVAFVVSKLLSRVKV